MATRLSIHSVYTSIVNDWAPGGRVPVGLRSKTSLAGYVFINDQLVRALYVVDQNHTDLIGYLSDYQHLKRALRSMVSRQKMKKFGQTISTRTNPGVWEGRRCWAFETVHCLEPDTTEVNVFLMDNNPKIDLSVDYSSTRLADLKNRAGKTAQGVLNLPASVRPAR